MESVMKQPKIEKWVRTQASISRRINISHWHKEFKAPEIWMLTGVQLVTDGELTTEASRNTKFAAGAGGDVGPAVNLPPGVAAVNAEAGHEDSAQAGGHFGYQGERVWAAQFMRVTFEFGKIPDEEEGSHPKTILKFNLEDVPDLQARGLRGSHEERMQVDGRPRTPPPSLDARVTVNESEDEQSDEYENAITIDDTPYVEAIGNTDWKAYNACLRFLADAEAERGSTD
jgi:hypothetical protein